MMFDVAALTQNRTIRTLVPKITTSTLSKKQLLMAGVALFMVALTACGSILVQSLISHEDTDDAYVTGHTSNISSRISGNVVQVYADDNQYVHAGDLLVKLDPTPYQVAVDQARAALEYAQRQAAAARTTVTQTATTATAQTTKANGDIAASEADVAMARSQVTESEAAVQEARSKVLSAQTLESQAKADFQRYSALVKEGAISQQQFDQAKTNYHVANAQVQSAKDELQQAMSKVLHARAAVSQSIANVRKSQGSMIEASAANVQTQVNRDQYQVALADIEKAKVDLKQALLNLSYTELRAPVSGHIGRKSLEVGQHVDPGQALMADVEDQPWIVANFKETQVGRMRTGQSVEIKIDSLPHHTFKGTVDSISPASGNNFALLPADNATGNFTKIVQRIPVKIVFDRRSTRGYESQIAQGMSVEVSVKVGS